MLTRINVCASKHKNSITVTGNKSKGSEKVYYVTHGPTFMYSIIFCLPTFLHVSFTYLPIHLNRPRMTRSSQNEKESGQRRKLEMNEWCNQTKATVIPVAGFPNYEMNYLGIFRRSQLGTSKRATNASVIQLHFLGRYRVFPVVRQRLRLLARQKPSFGESIISTISAIFL